MFTLQAADVESQLSQAGMPIAQANAIANGFGNCMQRLEHRGTVDLSGPFITRGPVSNYGVNTFEPSSNAIFKGNVDFSDANFKAGAPYKATPPLKIKLTSSIARTSEGGIYVWKATAKLWKWKKAIHDYAVFGNDFDVYEINRRFRHAMTGDTGAIAWDFERKVPYLWEMNTPSVRHVTLSSDLSRGGHVAGIDMDTGETISRIDGRTIPTSKKLVHDTVRVVIQWFPMADASTGASHDGDGVWRAISADTCPAVA